MILIKKTFLILVITIALLFSASSIWAQTETPTPSPSSQDESQQVKDLQNRITELQSKISDLQGQAKTLSSQIAVMDNQIKLTEYRIESTKTELLSLAADIDTADKKINTLEKNLSGLMKVLVNRIVATYKVGGAQSFEVLVASSNISNFFTRLNYLRIAQVHDKKLIYDTQQAKVDYANQKNIFENKKKKIESLKKQLESYTMQLDMEKGNKQQLLSVTQNDEEKYQKLLQQAQAQISAFKSFSTALTGGSVSILPPQPSPDGWYYNQRDERWGRNTIGSSSDQVWDVGCLLTSVAMVLKKNGNNVTPADIAANSGYFFSNTAYMLLPWAGRFNSTWGFNQSDIDSKLSGGTVVIVGVRAGVYGMHFIVLKSGSGGNYTMNDPWYGPDLNFSSHYNTSQIFQYGTL
jgi:peptidoglycan hydrolase CwlO-like protein